MKRFRSALGGGVAGLILAIGIAFLAPEAALGKGDSRALVAVVGALFLVPAGAITGVFMVLTFKTTLQNPRERLIGIFFALFFTIACAASASSDWTAARRFTREGRITDGLVLEAHPEDHNRVTVSYTVEGTEYRARMSALNNARDSIPGETVPVYYYASVPKEGLLRKPTWNPFGEFIGWIGAAVIGPIWLLGAREIIVSRIRATRQKGTRIQSPI